MEIETPERKKFGGYLRSLIKNNGLLQKDVAKTIRVSEQYFSRLMGGVGTLTKEQFDIVVNYLRPYISEDETDRIFDLYILAKSGMEYERNLSPVFSDPTTEIFAMKFNRLTHAQQIEIITVMERMEMQNYDKMAQNAGIAEKPAIYSGANRMKTIDKN